MPLFRGPPIVFSANKNAINQAGLVSGVWTKVTFPNPVINDAGIYNAGLSRVTPPAGRYRFNCAVYATSVTPNDNTTLGLYKNGTFQIGQFTANDFVFGIANPSFNVVDECNGLDFYEVYAFVVSGATATLSGAPQYTYFQGSPA